MSSENASIGIFDSGVGGLTVLRQLKAIMPKQHCVYLADLARYPYGTKSSVVVEQYARECAGFLVDRGVGLIVIGCNTASSVAARQLREECSCPVIDVIEPTARKAVEISKSKKVGIIATPGTIASQAYSDQIAFLDTDIQIFTKACPLFVPLVEEGILGGELVDLAIDRYLSSMRNSGIDTLVLGCTHYPLLKEPLARYFGPQVQIVDSGVEAAKAAKVVLDQHFKLDVPLEEQGMLCSSSSGEKGSCNDSYFVTETTEHFERIAAPFLGKDSVHAVRVHRL